MLLLFAFPSTKKVLLFLHSTSFCYSQTQYSANFVCCQPFLFIFFIFLYFLLFFSPKMFVINKKERIALSFQFIIYTITRVYSSNSSCAFSDASSVITAVTFFKEQIEVKSSLPILEESISR